MITRRVAIAALGTLAAGSVVGLGYEFRSLFESPAPGFRVADGPGNGGMMGRR